MCVVWVQCVRRARRREALCEEGQEEGGAVFDSSCAWHTLALTDFVDGGVTVQNRRLYEEQVLKNRRADMKTALEEEAEVQAAVSSIEAQRRFARELELKRLMQEQEAKDRAEFLVCA